MWLNCYSEMKVKAARSCPTLCGPMDYTVHGILQVRILEWVAFLFSRGSSKPRNWTRISCIAGGSFTNWTMREALDYCLLSYYIFWFNCVLTASLPYCDDKIRRFTKGLLDVLFSLFKPDDAASFRGLRGHVSERHRNHTQHLAHPVFILQFVAIN